LVELLIVVVILGILAAVAIPRFLTTKEESQRQACRSNLSAIQSKIEEMLFTGIPQGTTPETYVATSTAALTADDVLTDANFPSGIPQCPSGSEPYAISGGQVTCPNDATHFLSAGASG